MEIKNLISQMTLEEKASLCSGKDAWNTKEIGRLNIPSVTVADGPYGLRKVRIVGDLDTSDSYPATCFPTASALASSWDTGLVSEVGEALADEALRLDVDVLLGPGINMKRSPLCGRNFEYYSESEWLSGLMGTAFVNGVQKKGVGTSLKHFACNNQEFHRMSVSAEVDERSLRETYLRAFEMVVKNASPWTVMCSYNKVNGEYASENEYLLNRILRDEWGFSGLVVSDWGAVDNRVKGLDAGLDLQMPGPAQWDDEKIIEAVKNGSLKMEKLDEAVERILYLVFKCKNTRTESSCMHDETVLEKHHTLAVKAASQCMVLLKNENNLLPLNAGSRGNMGSKSKISIIGLFAKKPRYQGKGSSQINSAFETNPYDEILKIAGDECDILYAQGYGERDNFMEDMAAEAADVASKSDTVLFFAGLPDWLESEGYDRKHAGLPSNQVDLLKRIINVNKNLVLILCNGSAVTFEEWIDEIPAIVESWLAGQGSGKAVAEILFGIVNPSGKLSETFPLKNSHNPSYLSFPGNHDVVEYKEGIYIGYKYYQKKQIPVRFPFGYGLSYTDFEYEDMILENSEYNGEDTLKFRVKVKNTGPLNGKETVQIYVKPENSRCDRPLRELRAFKKLEIGAGQTVEFPFELARDAFECYNIHEGKWILESGTYTIEAGSSCENILLERKLRIKSGDEFKSELNGFSTVHEWFGDAKGRECLRNTMPEIYERFKDMEDDDEDDFLRMIYEASMIKVIEFLNRNSEVSPSSVVEMMISAL